MLDLVSDQPVAHFQNLTGCRLRVVSAAVTVSNVLTTCSTVRFNFWCLKMEPLERMRRLVPDQFHSLVKMHLSFILDLNYDDCDCNFVFETTPSSTPSKSKGIFSGAVATPRRSKNPSAYKGVMEGAPLTMEGVCQVSQIIDYLKRNLDIEGLFR